MSIIQNANQVTLDQNSGTLPQVNDAMADYFQAMTFETVVKTVVNFQVVETPTSVSFQGVWQPFSAQRLMIKPEGQRDWKWFMLHAEIALTLKPDEVVTYLGTQYRVMSKADYSLYGYVLYELVDDFTGSGP